MVDLKKEEKEEEEEEVKWANHYSSLQQILLVGEGDFSFSLSLANAFGSASNMVSTSLDSHDTVVEKYSNAKSNLESLKEMGATIIHEVDATKMKFHTELKMQKFDRIVFNFPHAGFKGKEDNMRLINLHRKLVNGFLKNAIHMLRPNAEIHISHKTGGPFHKWNLEELASMNSLILTERACFKIEDYPGYNNKRGDGARIDQPFPLGECSTFKFRVGDTRRKKKALELRHGFAETSRIDWAGNDFLRDGWPGKNFAINVVSRPMIPNFPPRIDASNGYLNEPYGRISGACQMYGSLGPDIVQSIPLHRDFLQRGVQDVGVRTALLYPLPSTSALTYRTHQFAHGGLSAAPREHQPMGLGVPSVRSPFLLQSAEDRVERPQRTVSRDLRHIEELYHQSVSQQALRQSLILRRHYGGYMNELLGRTWLGEQRYLDEHNQSISEQALRQRLIPRHYFGGSYRAYTNEFQGEETAVISQQSWLQWLIPRP